MASIHTQVRMEAHNHLEARIAGAEAFAAPPSPIAQPRNSHKHAHWPAPYPKVFPHPMPENLLPRAPAPAPHPRVKRMHNKLLGAHPLALLWLQCP